MEIKFTDNVVEQNLDIKGVKVKILKSNKVHDSFQICIYDNEDRFILSKLPDEYDDFGNLNNILFDNTTTYKWWCGKLCDILQYGYFKNGDSFNLKCINIIIEAIVNGVNKLEELNTVHEIIKIGNVTIEKTKVDKNNVSLTITGLSQPCDYPYDLWHNSNTLAWTPDNEVFDLWDEDHEVVWINNKQYFPLKDFICSNSDAEKVIKIITASEEKLAKYKWEQKEIKVGDYVKPKDYVSDYKYKVIAIHNDEIWVQSIGRCSITGIYSKDFFIKDNTKL